jgi:hypothetical protein
MALDKNPICSGDLSRASDVIFKPSYGSVWFGVIYFRGLQRVKLECALKMQIMY